MERNKEWKQSKKLKNIALPLWMKWFKEELKTYNKLDIVAFNLIRGFQNRSNYEETIGDIKDFLYDLYLAKYDEEHPIKWLSTPPRMLSIISKIYNNNWKIWKLN